MTARVDALLARLVETHRRGGQLVLLFDYDGTLVPLEAHPSLVRLDAATRELLGQLAGLPRVLVGILSGRMLDELAEMVSLADLCLAGTAGLELHLYGTRLANPQAERARSWVAHLAERLDGLPAAFPGVWLENKGLGLTVHYRDVPGNRVGLLRAEVERTVAALAWPFRLTDGPMAVEITPELGWNKGTAVERILDSLPAGDLCVLYAGDEANDADALETVVALGGIALGIGPRAPDAAQHRLADPAALIAMLQRLLAALA
jgi:trehalose 6-phosphate phosphatase